MSIRSWINIAVFGWVTAAALGIYIINRPGPTPERAALQMAKADSLPIATKPAPRPVAQPSHRYSVKDGFDYSYEKALSTADQIAGSVTTPMLTVRYLGERDGRHQIFHKPNTLLMYIYECDSTCEFLTAYQYVNGEHSGTEKMRVKEGSVVGAIFNDAIGGKLEPFLYVRNGKPMQGFVDRSGSMKFYPPPAAAPGKVLDLTHGAKP